MPRLRKLRRKQKFQYHVNRKSLNKKKTKLPKIQCDTIRNAWDNRKSLNDNLTSMGLVADTNAHKSFHIPSTKDQMMPVKIDDISVDDDGSHTATPVIAALEAESREGFKAKKEIAHPLPKQMVKKLTGFLDKYGEDYEAMSRDFGNYNQETPAQLRSQINRLKKIPQQWIPYLKSRGLIPPSGHKEKEEEDTQNVEIEPKSE